MGKGSGESGGVLNKSALPGSWRIIINFASMADVHDKITRSYNMSRIRATNTKPEMLVRKR